MTTLTWPNITSKPTRQQWQLQSLTQTHESPLTGSVQTQSLPGARWMTTIEYEGITDPDEQATLQTFSIQLRGRAGRVNVPNYGWTRRGSGSGTVLVKGGSQTGTTLLTDGWTAGATVKVGDFFQVGSEMKMIITNATADGSGNMTLTFEPPLRDIPNDNAPINYTAPVVTMMPLGDVAPWTYEAGDVMSFTFDLMENI